MTKGQFYDTTFRRLLAARLPDSEAQRLAGQITRDADQYAAHVAEIAARPPDHWGTR
jgi:hypothetical protein